MWPTYIDFPSYAFRRYAVARAWSMEARRSRMYALTRRSQLDTNCTAVTRTNIFLQAAIVFQI